MDERGIEILLSDLVDEGIVELWIDPEGNRYYSASEGNSLHGTMQKIIIDEAVASVRLDHDPEAETIALEG